MPAPSSAPSKKSFPPIIGVRWFNVSVLTITPLVAAYGLRVAPLHRGTVAFAMLYYVFSMLGEPHLSAILKLI
jgi:stearoyl-CoA desaturase (Delta-9 desaturase)